MRIYSGNLVLEEFHSLFFSRLRSDHIVNDGEVSISERPGMSSSKLQEIVLRTKRCGRGFRTAAS